MTVTFTIQPLHPLGKVTPGTPRVRRCVGHGTGRVRTDNPAFVCLLYRTPKPIIFEHGLLCSREAGDIFSKRIFALFHGVCIVDPTACKGLSNCCFPNIHCINDIQVRYSYSDGHASRSVTLIIISKRPQRNCDVSKSLILSQALFCTTSFWHSCAAKRLTRRTRYTERIGCAMHTEL